MKRRRLSRALVLIGVATITVLAVAWWGAAKLGYRIGRDLGSAYVRIGLGKVDKSPPEPPPEEELDLWAPDDGSAGSGDAGSGSGATRRASSPTPHPVGTIVVARRTVEQLANTRARPTGVPVARRGAQPSGIRLRGVARLGIGLLDGDVLTHVEKHHVRSKSEVVQIVLAMRGRGVPRISGTVWRSGKPYRIMVEQPYISADASSAVDPSPQGPE